MEESSHSLDSQVITEPKCEAQVVEFQSISESQKFIQEPLEADQPEKNLNSSETKQSPQKDPTINPDEV